MTLKARAAWLVNSLRNAHRARTDTTATHAARMAAAIIAEELANEASEELLRAALVMAVQPDGGQPPIPVVFGPQDVAAVIGRDEVMALIERYGWACGEYGRGTVTHGPVGRAHQEVAAAVDRLCLAASAVELDRAHGEGRLS